MSLPDVDTTNMHVAAHNNERHALNSMADLSDLVFRSYLSTYLLPKWQPNASYVANDVVVSPAGSLVKANTTFVSGATYNAVNWTIVSVDATGFVLKWKALTTYVAGDTVLAPDGSLVKAKVNFTSGTTYSSTNWSSVSAKTGTQDRTELEAIFAPIASPTLTGTPSAPTPGAGDNGDRIATTSFATTVAQTSKAEAVATSATDATNKVATETSRATTAEGVNTTAITAHTGNVSNPHAVTKVQVSLGNADNTSDAAKPVSTAQQTALNLKEDLANKNAVNGYAGLDGSGKVAASQLPAYVDDVLEFANLAGFPGSGTTGIIYTALDTNKVYRWSGSAYIEISPSPGSTDVVAEGSTNLYYTNARVLAVAYRKPTATIVTANYTILSADSIIAASATSGVNTQTLPTPVGKTDQIYRVTKTDSSTNSVTVATAAGNINGDATFVLYSQRDYVEVQSDGTNWIVIAARRKTLTFMYNTAQTYTAFVIPQGAVSLFCKVLGSDGGGGSGRRGAAGTIRCGGGGGGTGGLVEWVLAVSELPSTIYVTVGAGGIGGAAVTTDSTDGNVGTAGGISTLTTVANIATMAVMLARANAGSGGAGGTATAGAGGAAGSGRFTGAVGGAASTTGLVGVAGVNTAGAAGSGGSGGGLTAANVASAGGTGGYPSGITTVTHAPAGGTAEGGNGANGTGSGAAGLYGSGGGGGGSAVAVAGGAGGNGFRGGGGGGGASTNGFNSGPGGTGGDGFVQIIVEF